MFHFAQWNFRDLPGVRPLTLKPHDDAPLDERYDVIFCFQTLEHLPRPLAILRHLHSVLKPGGHFVFDYIASLGEGLDTPSARAERPAALEFVNTHYRVLEGSPDEGSGVVVCRKDG
jgi:2-polyprenyl-3-methyl-5-hydroxy-6-metoxy-1,4-benzoquinol methylase